MTSPVDQFRLCPVGLLTNEYYDNIDTFVQEASEAGHDFVATPMAHPSFRRVLHEDKKDINKSAIDQWRNAPVFDRQDLILQSAGCSDIVVGMLAEWLQLDSIDESIRVNSELALKQELAWASHLGLLSVIYPGLPKGALSNTARAINHATGSLSFTQLWVRIPISDTENMEKNSTWKQWNKLRMLTEQNTKIYVALELTEDLPHDDILDMWLAEPVKALIVPAEVFIPNAKGFPVLPKRHQAFVKKVMDKLRPNILVTVPIVHIHASATPSTYQEYIRYLNRNLPELDQVNQFATGYQDYLQAPLQPLMDNLDNNTYETFEKDPIKYQQYEQAVYRALLDRVEPESDITTMIMVVGAGRGPLVDCCLRAASKSGRKIHLYAVEKNPNAFVTLQNKKANEWHEKVELVFADMRKWKPSKKCDILVSELLGSFGDNELSPECLDGAQKFLKDDGISIPANYTTFAAPLASTKLYNEVAAYKDLEHFETPYVVMFQQVCELGPSQPLWTFEHPNHNYPTMDDDPINNLHNIRYSQTKFTVDKTMTMHGVAGYFESVLYKDVTISIHPDTHSPGMFSWFPIFFPIRTPLQVPQGAQVCLDFWRQTDKKKIWYEWAVTISKDNEDLAITPIHNVGGRSYWVGL
ncbi:PRMT5 arginine-N-methyltransferase-domain-containing protein [Halteromyces radiatus]|uniref:PRMT5 arginine-N-methyltransferase-domain-containing protein n=1 Tax=Halteromyces radiatus TaxID=101107 RepID=UPI00222036DA|nr:PRMT5 arginine-N-methyltransferase-domain-containing protein [Halteromyces radiatus]KAI8099404.1 PRMT5 arginine-N-methyltransferase-domain-containing protein [Halteromyces radiatus]